jgi:hypothetical protein
MPQVGRMTRPQISTLTLALALGLTPLLSAEAGGFRTGSYQTKDSSSSHRNITSGMEEIRSERTYTNTINGSSRIDHIGMTMQADGFAFSRQIDQLDASLGAHGLSRDRSAAGMSQSDLLQWSASSNASSGNSADHDLNLQMPGIGLESLLTEKFSQSLGTDVSGSQSFSGGAINLQASDSAASSVLERLQTGEQIGMNGSLDLRIERGGQNAVYAMQDSGSQRLHSIERFTGSSVYQSERNGRGDLFAFD